MYRVAVFDDDRLQCEALADLVGRSSFGSEMSVETFSDIEALARYVGVSGEPDICLMDIGVAGGEDGVRPMGIQAVARLFPAGCRTQVIYVTGYVEYCVPVYETQHVYLLFKPVRPDQLQAALAKAVANLRAQEPDYLVITSGGAVAKLPIAKIVYVESMRRKAVVHTTDGLLETYAKLSDLAAQLPPSFVRSHKSYLVNMDHIDCVERAAICLSTGTAVPVSRQRSAGTREAFRRHLLSRALNGSEEG